MAEYEISKNGRFIARDTAKNCCEILGISSSMFYDHVKKGSQIFNQYDVKMINSKGDTKYNLTDRQKEIIKEQFEQGVSTKNIAYNTGILEIAIIDYTNELQQLSKKSENKVFTENLDIDRLIEEKLNNKLRELNNNPLEAILTMKALGYVFKESDSQFYLKDDTGVSKRAIKLANNQAHIRSFDKVKSCWSMPYSISYNEIEAIYNEITEKRGCK